MIHGCANSDGSMASLQERLRDKVHLQTVRILDREDALTPRMEEAGEEGPRHVARPPARGARSQYLHLHITFCLPYWEITCHKARSPARGNSYELYLGPAAALWCLFPCLTKTAASGYAHVCVEAPSTLACRKAGCCCAQPPARTAHP